MGTGAPLLRARDVRLSFGPTPALRGANLDVRRGEILAVMGPSGSGKPTYELYHSLVGRDSAGQRRFLVTSV